MNRRTRTVVVVGIAVTVASLASFGVYRVIQDIPVREVPIATVHTVVARQALPVGIRVRAADLKVVPWPESNPVSGGFTDIDDVVGRGVVASVVENEPLTERKLAPLEAGAGLPPTITHGMRAISVKVNDVIGVAGFVVPGTRVDVVVTRRDARDSMARVVVSNVEVLAAGTKYDQDKGREEGEPVRSTVITLLVTPPDAERIALAGNEGQIMLALRNPLDVQPTETAGIRMASLMGAPDPPPVRRTVRNRQVVVTPPPPQPYIIEAIRAAKRTQETIQ